MIDSNFALAAGCLIDGWTRLRDACVHALLWMPTPLPGYEDPQQMQSLVTHAAGLLKSPRVRESDAGAHLLAIIFRKHVVDLGWSIKFCAQGTSRASAAAPSSNIASKDDEQDPAMTFIASLLSLFQVCGLFLAG